MDSLLDGIFGTLFDQVDPLGMILRTLMALLADSLSTLITTVYAGLFEITTVDLSATAVRNIWAITTGISASLAVILLVIAAFRAMIAQSNRYLLEALPGVVLAILGPQFITVFLPWLAAASTDLAQGIVASATPDLAASMRLLAGVGPNPLYEGLGLIAPIIAAMLLFGLSMVFFVLLFCMAGAVVLYVLSPFAFAGLVMAPTRAWFTKWATAMFALLFAKVPIAILLALSVSLFANSAHAGGAQSFVNAGAGLILGLGALLSPLLAYGLFSFMGTAATRPTVPSTNPSQAMGSTYYGTQMGRAGINGVKNAATRIRGGTGTGTTPRGPAGSPSTGTPGGTAGAAGSRGSGRTGSTPGPSPSPNGRPRSPVPAPMRSAPARPFASTGRTPGSARALGTARTGGAATSGPAAAGGATAGTAAAAGAATAGVGALVVVGAAAGAKARRSIKHGLTSTADTVATGTGPAITARTAT
ncbi:MAG: hypothetical protein Q8M17_08160 [Actinomycetota bacterium]|nr:hypothetical protein [Actinomycetota bacterium]